MRRGRATLTALVLVLLSMFVTGTAHAGGPTSALLVVPGAGQTAALYNSDADYNSLATLVGAFEAPGKVDRSGASHEAGAGVTVTWLIHDVQVWRVDRIYVVDDGKAWISTQVDLDGSNNIWASPVVWHTATDSRGLTTLLTRLGVNPAGGPGAVSDTGTGTGTNTDTDTDASVAPSPAASKQPSSAATSQTKSQESPSWAGPLWGIAGLALGGLIAVLAMWTFPNARLGRRSDAVAEPGRHDATDPNWSPSEELSWPVPRK